MWSHRITITTRSPRPCPVDYSRHSRNTIRARKPQGACRFLIHSHKVGTLKYAQGASRDWQHIERLGQHGDRAVADGGAPAICTEDSAVSRASSRHATIRRAHPLYVPRRASEANGRRGRLTGTYQGTSQGTLPLRWCESGAGEPLRQGPSPTDPPPRSMAPGASTQRSASRCR